MSKKPKTAPGPSPPTTLLASLLQYIGPQLDAKALLMALPQDELAPPFAALRRLMTTPAAFDGQWSMLRLDLVPDAYMSLVLVALPAIPRVDLSIWYTRAAAADKEVWLAASVYKLKSMHLSWLKMPSVHSALPMCTQLERAGAVSNPSEMAEALRLLPPSVRRLDFDSECFDDAYLAALSPWLRKGHARHLCFVQPGENSNVVGLAELLASTTSLTTLDLDMDADLLIDALAATNLPLDHFKAIRFYSNADDNVVRFLHRLDHATLTRLDASGLRDFHCLVPLLAEMSQLEELALRLPTDSVVPAALGVTRFPCLRVLTIQFYELAYDCVRTFFHWTCALPQLTEVHWVDVTIGESVESLRLLKQAIRRWITMLSVLSFRGDDFVEKCLHCIGHALRARKSNPRALLLDLGADQLQYLMAVDNICVLLTALRGLAHVTLELCVNPQDEAFIKAYARTERIAMEILERRRSFPEGRDEGLVLRCRFHAF
ncbi:hypothetical protein SDRG_15277 [Saprolegnia diclina VS20]|uniref:F-box domain-containing protein n=1 Tax=Saprolegnia diclina (strain VS20) TaxID=1156394 RepID=T0PXI1_SAPDV|nr:hypothetical protein SDRG_15277 [Saprolegnia diclina VS20]EQC26946.1 hypothetical protein SDRG_15277 [Saprolegnia diclina VS20]|eukprot:XP_008619667.1 hypothetical protein SDRG_15277 [Saprolegnia diclina VS20]